MPRYPFYMKLGALPSGFVTDALRRWVTSTLAAKGTRVCKKLLCVGLLRSPFTALDFPEPLRGNTSQGLQAPGPEPSLNLGVSRRWGREDALGDLSVLENYLSLKIHDRTVCMRSNSELLTLGFLGIKAHLHPCQVTHSTPSITSIQGRSFVRPQSVGIIHFCSHSSSWSDMTGPSGKKASAFTALLSHLLKYRNTGPILNEA